MEPARGKATPCLSPLAKAGDPGALFGTWVSPAWLQTMGLHERAHVLRSLDSTSLKVRRRWVMDGDESYLEQSDISPGSGWGLWGLFIQR
jgi:hypothetical protein